jgi:hypothetical protein
MDRLLRAAFRSLIRGGNLRVTTGGGSTFSFGDGTGSRAAIRFTTRAAERGRTSCRSPAITSPAKRRACGYWKAVAGRRCGSPANSRSP